MHQNPFEWSQVPADLLWLHILPWYLSSGLWQLLYSNCLHDWNKNTSSSTAPSLQLATPIENSRRKRGTICGAWPDMARMFLAVCDSDTTFLGSDSSLIYQKYSHVWMALIAVPLRSRIRWIPQRDIYIIGTYWNTDQAIQTMNQTRDMFSWKHFEYIKTLVWPQEMEKQSRAIELLDEEPQSQSQRNCKLLHCHKHDSDILWHLWSGTNQRIREEKTVTVCWELQRVSTSRIFKGENQGFAKRRSWSLRHTLYSPTTSNHIEIWTKVWPNRHSNFH